MVLDRVEYEFEPGEMEDGQVEADTEICAREHCLEGPGFQPERRRAR